jgi:TonB family protein
MSARMRTAGAPADFRGGLFDSIDGPSVVSFGSTLILGAAFLAIVIMTPVRSFESLTLEQLPDRVTRLLLNESDLARLSAPEVAALPADAVVPAPDATSPDPADAPEPAPTVSRVAPPSDARGLPGSEPGDGTGGDGSGGGGGPIVGARGVAVAAGVAQAVAATGALAEVDRIVGDFTGVVASERGGKALRQGGSGGGVERRTGTAGARARTGADLGGVDEILGAAGSGGGRGGAGTAGAGAGGGGGGGGGGVGRAQVRIAAPAAIGADAAAAGATRSPGALMAVVQRHAAAVRFCYNRLLQKKPGASGQIVIRLTVAADGSVAGADIARSTLGDAELDACVLGQAREWRFAPADEARFTFDVPLVFTPPAGG